MSCIMLVEVVVQIAKRIVRPPTPCPTPRIDAVRWLRLAVWPRRISNGGCSERSADRGRVGMFRGCSTPRPLGRWTRGSLRRHFPDRAGGALDN